jgi:hypothetical protein
MVAMEWTNRDEAIWEELQEWRQSFFEYEPTDFENAYDKWIDQAFSLLPDSLQSQFFEKVDGWLFHLNSLLRGTQLQSEASERIVGAARSFDDQVDTLADLRRLSVDKLTYLAQQQAAKHRLYSLIQGGMAGSGKAVWASSDFFAMLVINLRAIQLTAMSFGYDVQTPEGLIETLKVYHTAVMPARLKMFGWEDLMNDLKKEGEEYYYDIPERITDQSWIDEPFKQVLKMALITMLSRKKISGQPLLSMVLGAGINYRTTKNITDFALKYYQYKHLWQKKGGVL